MPLRLLSCQKWSEICLALQPNTVRVPRTTLRLPADARSVSKPPPCQTCPISGRASNALDTAPGIQPGPDNTRPPKYHGKSASPCVIWAATKLHCSPCYHSEPLIPLKPIILGFVAVACALYKLPSIFVNFPRRWMYPKTYLFLLTSGHMAHASESASGHFPLSPSINASLV